MSVQTSYQRLTDDRISGSLADINNAELQSLTAEIEIQPARALVRGTDPNEQVLKGTDANGVFVGISIRDLAREGAVNTGDINYQIGDSVSILRAGLINVNAPAGATAGDLVFFSNSNGALGAGTAGAGETQIDGATWESTVASGEVGVVRIPSNVTLTAGA